jgi:hypothetical protein
MPLTVRRLSAMAATIRKQGVENAPFRVRQIAATQCCLPQKGSLESKLDSSVKNRQHDLDCPFVLGDWLTWSRSIHGAPMPQTSCYAMHATDGNARSFHQNIKVAHPRLLIRSVAIWLLPFPEENEK